MSAQHKTILLDDDFLGFSSKNSVVRIFNRNKGWYIGIYAYAQMLDDICLLRLNPFMSFERISHTNLEPRKPRRIIFDTRTDQVRGVLKHELAFQFKNPQKIEHPNQDILIIQSDDAKVALISQRPQDFAAIKGIRNFAEFLST